MVGFDPKQTTLTKLEQSYVVASSAILSRFFIQPFDVVKIRFQVQHEPISKRSYISKYTSIGQCVKTIVGEEGLFALWKGHLTGQFLSVGFNSSQFLWFESLTRLTEILVPSSVTDKHKKIFTHFACGGAAAILTILSIQPIDVIRTRLVSQGEPKVYKGIGDALRKIIAYEGFKGLYKGTIPALMLTTPETAIRFGVYQFLNTMWPEEDDKSKRIIKTNDKLQIGLLQSSINGAVAGLIAKTCTYPFDLAKKRLQIQGFEEARIQFGKVVAYNGLVDCFYKTIKEEGIIGLYKGVMPSMLKATVSSGLVFFFYEQFSNLVRYRKRNANSKSST